jgi:C-terminal processing protease CtpA/Prc
LNVRPLVCILSSYLVFIIAGVAPDLEVEMTPKLVIAGHDPQLEAAIQLILAELEQNPPRKVERPSSPNRVAKPVPTKSRPRKSSKKKG